MVDIVRGLTHAKGRFEWQADNLPSLLHDACLYVLQNRPSLFPANVLSR